MGFEIKDNVLIKYTEETGVTEVTIPDGVTGIGERAFHNCENLTNIIIPDSVTSIGDVAFAFCTSLTDITIPDSVIHIGGWAFDYCTSLTSITIPNSVTSIGCAAFASCTSFTSITIPENVNIIEDSLFWGCKSLEKIKVNENNKTYCDVDGVLFSKDKKTLLICPPIKTGNYSVPKSVTNIGSYAFFACTELTSINIPDSVITIGDCAFYHCIKLKGIIINGNEFKINRTEIENAKENVNDALNMILKKDFSMKFSHKVKFRLIMDYFFCTGDEEAEVYLKKNFSKVMKQCIENNDIDRINKILKKTDFITKRNINHFIAYSAENNKHEVQNILTDYKQQGD